jgi:hypothetical protein
MLNNLITDKVTTTQPGKKDTTFEEIKSKYYVYSIDIDDNISWADM